MSRLWDFEGNGYQNWINGTPRYLEADLGFELQFSQSESSLDPVEAPAPRAVLFRRDASTTLRLDHDIAEQLEPGGCCIQDEPGCAASLSCPVLLNFELATASQNPLQPAVPLLINSARAGVPHLSGPFSRKASLDSGTGGGIVADKLTNTCGHALTSFDQHVFEVLARTIVASGCYSRGPSNCQALGEELSNRNVTIFRGADAHTYRINIYSVQYACGGPPGPCFLNLGPIALQVHVNWDPQGRLTNGDVRVLPACRGGQKWGCSDEALLADGLGIYFLRPIFAGHEEQKPAAFVGAPYLYASTDTSLRKHFAPVDWAALLAGTSLGGPATANVAASGVKAQP